MINIEALIEVIPVGQDKAETSIQIWKQKLNDLVAEGALRVSPTLRRGQKKRIFIIAKVPASPNFSFAPVIPLEAIRQLVDYSDPVWVGPLPLAK